jgi:hypothetical protein
MGEAMSELKIIHHPLHDWQDAQRRKDEPENRLREIDEHFHWLWSNGYQEALKGKWQELGFALRLAEKLK